MTSADHPLRKLRVLVVEDTYLIAEMIKDSLEDAGFEVIGPAPNIEQGLTLSETESVDVAVLDINLAGSFCFPIATALRARNVPFFFLSGYTAETIIPAEFKEVPRVSKPFNPLQIAAAVAACQQA